MARNTPAKMARIRPRPNLDRGTWLPMTTPTAGATASRRHHAGGALACALGQRQRHYIDSVREIMCEDSSRHQDSCLCAGAEAEPDGDTVQRAMENDARRLREWPIA